MNSFTDAADADALPNPEALAPLVAALKQALETVLNASDLSTLEGFVVELSVRRLDLTRDGADLAEQVKQMGLQCPCPACTASRASVVLH